MIRVYQCDCGTAIRADLVERNLGMVTVLPAVVVCNACGNQMTVDARDGRIEPEPKPKRHEVLQGSVEATAVRSA